MMQGFRKLAVSVGVVAWVNRGLEPPGRSVLEDTADEVFANVVINPIDGTRDFESWNAKRQADYARASVRNACIARAAYDLRYHRYKERAEAEWQMKEENQITVEQIVEAKISFEKVSEEMETLSQETHFILALSASDVPIEHIAKLLFMTPSAVRQRLHRGRQRLREVVGR